LRRRTAKTLELASLHRDQAEQTLPADDVAWIARVAWVRQ
jgi:phage repressor protein C with HTH and peptisase S24 domain